MSEVVGPQYRGSPTSGSGPAGASAAASARQRTGSSGGAGYGGGAGAAEDAIRYPASCSTTCGAQNIWVVCAQRGRCGSASPRYSQATMSRERATWMLTTASPLSPWVAYA